MDRAESLVYVEAGFRAQLKCVWVLLILEFHCSPSDMDCSAQSIKKWSKALGCHHFSGTSDGFSPNSMCHSVKFSQLNHFLGYCLLSDIFKLF